MKAMTTKQASKDLDGLIEKLITDTQPTILCNDKGNQAILMSLDEFNAWQETIYLLSNPANTAHLLGSVKSAQAGEVLKEL